MPRSFVAVVLLGVAGCFQPIAQEGLDDGGAGGGAVALAGGPGGGGAAGGGAAGGAAGGGAASGTLCSAVSLTGSTVQPAGPCICTRRDVVPVGSCPRGQNQSVSATIGPAGGELVLRGQQGLGVPFSITFPPNALTTATRITVTETNIPPPAGVVDWSPLYRIEPTDLVLAEAAKVQVPWSQGRGTALGGGDLYWSTGSTCALEKLPSSSTNAGFAMANVGRLGFAMVAYAQVGEAQYCQ